MPIPPAIHGRRATPRAGTPLRHKHVTAAIRSNYRGWELLASTEETRPGLRQRESGGSLRRQLRRWLRLERVLGGSGGHEDQVSP